MALLLVGGVALRVVVTLAYWPALLYIDSFHYLDNVGPLDPAQLDPIGYPLLLLRPLLAAGHSLAVVALVQHLFGLLTATLLYCLLLRWGVRRWVAALAGAPLLLDAYQVQIEHNIMSDLLFQVLLAAVLTALLWRGAPRMWSAGLVGVLLAAAVTVRAVGLPLVVPTALYLFVAGRRADGRTWGRRLAVTGAMLGCFAVGVLGYATYFHTATGQWRISAESDSVLYGRAAQVVDCAKLQQPLQALCPPEPRDQRLPIDTYAHSPDLKARAADLAGATGLPVAQSNAVRSSFAVQVARQQPLAMAGSILRDFAKGFAVTRTSSPNDVPLDRWQFQTSYPRWDLTDLEGTLAKFTDGPAAVNPPLAGFLRGYQLTVGYTSGVVLAGGLLLALAAVAGFGRARKSGMRAACLVVATFGVAVLLTAATFEFSWRYQLPALVLLPLAGALGWTALTRARPAPSPFPSEVDRAALRDYRDRYGARELAPAVVVIAAYNEAEGIGPVLDAIPARSCGLDVDTLVVVDGSTDGTTETALAHGAYVCPCPENRGQGAALRLGYHLARVGGARFVVTTDADGQYDIDELPLLLEPLIADDADFVTGSRRLGRQETADPVRQLGVRVFSWLASRLTSTTITDTSFGFRAMRAEVTEQVTLRQPQYQASELLISLLAKGFRVLEQPMTMRARTAGRSKKGNNLVYGLRYARVLLGTWLRERHPSNPQPAPAIESVRPGFGAGD